MAVLMWLRHTAGNMGQSVGPPLLNWAGGGTICTNSCLVGNLLPVNLATSDGAQNCRMARKQTEQ